MGDITWVAHFSEQMANITYPDHFSAAMVNIIQSARFWESMVMSSQKDSLKRRKETRGMSPSRRPTDCPWPTRTKRSRSFLSVAGVISVSATLDAADNTSTTHRCNVTPGD